LVLGLISLEGPLLAQGTAFTYQGSLTDNGAPATGAYDLVFVLFNAFTSGGQINGAVTNLGVGVTNGVFTTTLDFGGNFPGADRWLEISVRSSSGGAFTTLNPRQKLTSTPYAITAANVTGGLPAAQLVGVIPAAQVGTFTNHSDVIISGLVPGQVLAYSGTMWTNKNVTLAGNGILVALSYTATNVPVNAALGSHFRLVATNNFQLQNPVGAADAQRMIFEIVQDAVGNRTMSLDSAFKLGSDLPLLNLTTNANRRDFLTCVCSGTNFYVVGFVKGY
jgi:hypothetical protein